MFYRVSSAVIAPNLTEDLGLNAETLGYLGGAFFYSFALFQIPMGPMLDRIGPRIVIPLSSLIGSAGAFLFAFGQTFTAALFGRILIGVGMSSVLMGSFKVFVLRFPPEKFSTLVGILYAVGTLGNIIAASPLAFLASTIGWRMTFIVVGSITALLAFVVFWAIGDQEKEKAPVSLPAPGLGILQSVKLVLGSLVFWQIGSLAFFRYGTFVGLQGLWLGPYLMDIKGYSPLQAGNALTLLAIGGIVGGPIAGRLSDKVFRSSKDVAFWGLVLYAASLIPLIGVFRIQNTFLYGLTFFFLGFFNGVGMMFYTQAKGLFPVAISGTVITWVNFFSISGGAVFMPALGRIIESFPHGGRSYPAEAYHLSFLICLLGMVASLIFYAFSKKEKASSEFGAKSSEAPN